MTAEQFIHLLGSKAKASKTTNGWKCCCPAHEDDKASLSITQAADRVLIHCHAGCTPEAVCKAAGINLSDLYNEPKQRTHKQQIAATYDYRDESGNLLLQTVRFEPKDFRQRRPDATAPDGWTWKTADVRRVLYRLPEIIRDVQRGLPIVVCEGEKDVGELVKLGFSPTCNLGGAGKWRDEYSDTLRGASVYIIADKDEPGRKHAQAVAASLHGKAAFVAVLELPDFNGRKVKDAADFISAGATAEDIQAQFEAAPEWKPQAVQLVTDTSSTSDVRGDLLATLTDKTLSTEAKRTKAAQIVVAALDGRGRFYFHAERRDFDTAMFFDAERKRLERIRGDSFKGWLSDWLRVNRADGAFNYLCAGIETAALSGDTTTGILPDAFWTSRSGAVYVSNGDGHCVKITAAGVALVDNGTDGVLFPAGRTLKVWRLVEPVSAFDTCAIFRDAHCSAAHGKDLVQLLVYSMPTDPRTKPAACFSGTVGSGKTRTAKAIAELFGLPQVVAKVEDSGEDDFWPMLDAGGLVILDNADTRNKWLPDALAAAATDGCTQRRKLYTNAETVTMRARAWCVVTSANPTFASDAGLADRLLVVRMDRSEVATSDAALSDEIAANRDAALSHIAETIRAALAETAPTPQGLNQRHPDFAAFAVRLGRALGREADAIAALRTAEADKSAFCIENDSIGLPLKTYLDAEGSFTGTAAELLEKLRAIDPDFADISAKRLGKRLAKIWPHLKSLFAADEKTDRKGIKTYHLKSPAAGFAGFQTGL